MAEASAAARAADSARSLPAVLDQEPPVLVCANKSDLMGARNEKQLEEELMERRREEQMRHEAWQAQEHVAWLASPVGKVVARAKRAHGDSTGRVCPRRRRRAVCSSRRLGAQGAPAAILRRRAVCARVCEFCV